MSEESLPISVAIITKNEQLNIGDCIKSCKSFYEVVVVDDYSSDDTALIARENGATVHLHRFKDFSNQKQYAIDRCNKEWVLLLDADERVTSDLRKEIAKLGLTPTMAYKIKRTNFFKGVPVKYSGWQNDCVTRLFNKTIAGLDGRRVHEKIVGAQNEVTLRHSIQHHPYNDDSQVKKKTWLYGNLAAEQAILSGRQISPLITPTLRGAWSFLRSYVFRFGFLDGKAGVEIAVMGFHYTRLKYQIFFQNLSANESVK